MPMYTRVYERVAEDFANFIGKFVPIVCFVQKTVIALMKSILKPDGTSKTRMGFMHNDVLLMNFTTKPRIQNANVFTKNRN